MIGEHEIIEEGFKPLRKMPTEPIYMNNNKKNVTDRVSAYTGTKAKAGYDTSSFMKMEKNRGKMLERSNSFIGQSTRSKASKDGCVIIVDPFSTGAHLALGFIQAGYKCGSLLSIWNSPVASLVQEGLVLPEFAVTIQHNNEDADQNKAINETVEKIRALPFPVIAVLAGAETGVSLADAVSHRLNLRSNGEENSLIRRNKYSMGEAVKNAGLRAVKQKLCTSLEEVENFVSTLDGATCVLKPVQSAGSDDVFMCKNYEEAATAFSRIYMKINGLGLLNDCVLAQEFLAGKEYVIDQVSKDGRHKLCALWQYDKRQVNGAAFVYYGNKLIDPNDSIGKALVTYARSVLDAVSIAHGPSHMECIFTESGPCLVEVGSRCQGGEGTWIPVVKECIGLTQVDCTVDVYLNGPIFDTLSDDKYTLKRYGRDVDLVSELSGVVRGTPGEKIIRSLPSFYSISWEIKPGDFLPATVDCFTRPGVAQLIGNSDEECSRDVEIIHKLGSSGRLIDFSLICPEPPNTGGVVVVDPFSSGANLAAMVIKMGYKLIICFSENNSPVAALSTGSTISTSYIVHHDSMARNQTSEIENTISKIKDFKIPILAILPGAETGVNLAEKLAHHYGTRNNGVACSPARRNKYLMQEAIRAAGIRAIMQQLCSSIEECAAFYNSLPEPQICIVKPNESAGSDSIFKCSSLDEVLNAFSSIHLKKNSLGQVNRGALCQEYLSGTEFVIDGVSRDGTYKVTAVWEYDKRTINNSNFVYFGMRLRSAVDEHTLAMIEYASHVVKTLEISHGPSHMEIINTTSGPCLVEVGSRCHGGEGTWMSVVDECIGYNQLEATLNCYLRPDRFDELPFRPVLKNEGCELFLVSSQTGVVSDIPGIEKIRSLGSFKRMEMLCQPGSHIKPTTDCFTRPGSVQMINASGYHLEKDYDFIRDLERNGELFEVINEA